MLSNKANNKQPQDYFLIRNKECNNTSTSNSKGNNTDNMRLEEFGVNQELCHAFIRNSPDGIIIINEMGTIIEWSPGEEQITGIPRSEALGQPLWEIQYRLAPEERRTPAFVQVAKERIVTGLKEGAGLRRILEEQIQRTDGSMRDIQSKVFAVQHSNGTLVGAIIRDITKSKQFEQILAKEKDKARHLLDIAGAIILAINTEGIVTLANIRACETLGYKIEEIVGKNWFDNFLPKRSRKEVKSAFDKLISGNLSTKEYFENSILTKQGEERVIFWHNSLIYDDRGKISGTLSSGEDITERKQAEEALVKAKDDLEINVKERTAELANVNEQLEVYTREIIRVQETERKRVAIELHDDTAQNLALLTLEIDKILNSQEKLPEDTLMRLKILRDDVNRTQKEVRRFSHELRPGVLEYLGLEAALEGLANDINDKGEIEVELEIKGKERRFSDEVELSLFRIAQEALNNSLKHSHATKACVNLRFLPKRVTLSISDNGKGFNVKRDGQDAIRRRRLGLIGMKERAALIGGKLKVKSIAGKGTVVSIEIMR